ncbi:hypothetical protein G9A89_008916 [Geosiphon pyriformis]|nr:hypothetical protein G9A89_008916 [Geosiphon pyriformis]
MFPHEHSNGARLSTLSLFPSLHDITLSSSSQIYHEPLFEIDSVANKPLVSWTIISNGWQDTQAILSNGDKLLVFCNDLYEVNFDGDFQKVGDGLGSISAATKLNEYAFVASKTGGFLKIDLSNYEHQKISIGGLNNITALVSFKDYLFAFNDDLWRIREDGYHERIVHNLGETLAAAVIQEDAYFVTSNGKLWRINLNDFIPTKIDSGWEQTTAMVARKDTLYIFCSDNLYQVDAEGNYQVLLDNWTGTVAAANSHDPLHVACDGDIYEINFFNSSSSKQH